MQWHEYGGASENSQAAGEMHGFLLLKKYCPHIICQIKGMKSMKILIAGAGPAGLYLAYLVKRQLPGWEVRIVEQNARDSTFGFGVVFSERALEFLRADDPQTYDRITPAMETWTDITVVHRGTPVVIDGIGFSAIGRLKFLQLLRRQLESAGDFD